MNHDNIIKALFHVSEGYRMLGVALGNISPELLQGSAPTAEPEPAPTAEPEPGGPPLGSFAPQATESAPEVTREMILEHFKTHFSNAVGATAPQRMQAILQEVGIESIPTA